MKDYYFIASLPMIREDGPPPMTATDFRERCRERLSAGAMAVLDALLDDRPAAHPFVAAWREADTQIRNAVARARAARRQVDAEDWVRPQTGFDVSIVEGVNAAFRRPDPRQRELALDALRNRLIDDIRGFDDFSRQALLAYGLKLRLAWKRQSIDLDAGKRRLTDALSGAEHPRDHEGPHDRGDAENGKHSE